MEINFLSVVRLFQFIFAAIVLGSICYAYNEGHNLRDIETENNLVFNFNYHFLLINYTIFLGVATLVLTALFFGYALVLNTRKLPLFLRNTLVTVLFTALDFIWACLWFAEFIGLAIAFFGTEESIYSYATSFIRIAIIFGSFIFGLYIHCVCADVRSILTSWTLSESANAGPFALCYIVSWKEGMLIDTNELEETIEPDRDFVNVERKPINNNSNSNSNNDNTNKNNNVSSNDSTSAVNNVVNKNNIRSRGNSTHSFYQPAVEVLHDDENKDDLEAGKNKKRLGGNNKGGDSGSINENGEYLDRTETNIAGNITNDGIVPPANTAVFPSNSKEQKLMLETLSEKHMNVPDASDSKEQTN